MALPTAGTVVAGQVYTAAAHNIIVGNVNQLGEGYTFVETAYFTSSGSFVKATYPYLRAIKVRLVGGGGGGCGVATNADGCGTGGGGGGYAERFYTDIASLDASVTVTVGAAGTGGAAGNNSGSNGGVSEFGTSSDAWHTRATGGLGGLRIDTGNRSAGAGGVGTNGNLLIAGSGGEKPAITSVGGAGGQGGSSILGGGARSSDAAGSDNAAQAPTGGYGGGGGGPRVANPGTQRAGGSGAEGIVIVELYA
jgi:hypothetical protein